ncbi:MAG: tetraacyldisaccharide 4'-kinase [Candidatus Omnitrophica bacterium]|nr:tetraacyldisaccharide 4'-kinase [Candidatus Omnitrophota bacterium]
MVNYLYNIATGCEKGFMAGIVRAFLFLLSLVYWLFIRLMIFFQGRVAKRLDCKVVSVGNITVGGTGKTVLVEYIARELKAQGRKVAVISRGYKRVTLLAQSAGVPSHQGTANSMGDEPYMLTQKLGDIPVVVDADRVRGINKAIREFSVDTVVLDDGFQQWRIKKDLEIVALDVANPFGNKHMLPRGLLREPLSSLCRADIFVLTKVNLNPDTLSLKAKLEKLCPKVAVFESEHQAEGFYAFGSPKELFGTEVFRGKPAVLFSGIGDPASFEELARNQGINVAAALRFPDHYNYGSQDFSKIFELCRVKAVETVITTEKDAARISPDESIPQGISLFILRIRLRLKDEQGFRNRLHKLYSF